ncbi:MAG: hypothetical protein ABH810_01585 [bacterium]
MELNQETVREYIDHPVTTASSETNYVQLSHGALGERARLKHLTCEEF